MPAYDAECPNCGFQEDVMRPSREVQDGHLVCDCGRFARVVLHPVMTVGIVGPVFVPQLGRSFSSQKEHDTWCRDNNVVRMDKHTSEYKHTREKMCDRENRLARTSHLNAKTTLERAEVIPT